MKDFLVIVIAIIFLFGWCPWFSQEEALSAISAAAMTQQGHVEGCTLTPDENTISKTAFGYTEIVSYTCSPLDLGSITEGQNKVFAIFWGDVFNMPNPIIR